MANGEWLEPDGWKRRWKGHTDDPGLVFEPVLGGTAWGAISPWPAYSEIWQTPAWSVRLLTLDADGRARRVWLLWSTRLDRFAGDPADRVWLANVPEVLEAAEQWARRRLGGSAC